MRVSPQGIELIKRFEGLELEAYQDIGGVWTVGYGHTGPDVRPGMKITERMAEALLRDDLRSREAAVRRLVRVALNQNEFDALASFVYNVGEGAFAKSTALKRLNRGDRLGAAQALQWWNKATIGGGLRPVAGLTRRRTAESAVFMAPAESPPVKDPRRLAENSHLHPIEVKPRRPNLASSRTVQGATVAGGAGVASATVADGDVRYGDEPVAADEEATTQAGDATQPGTLAPSVNYPDASAQVGLTDDSMMQLVTLAIMVLALLYVVFARVDDWFRYKR
jgi:lysozyme